MSRRREKHEIQGPSDLVTLITVMGNLLGASLTFAYFTRIEAGLILKTGPDSVGLSVKFFLAVVGVIILAEILVGWTFFRPDRRFAEVLRDGDPDQIRLLVGRIINLPLSIAVLSGLGWLAAGGTISLAPFILGKMDANQWHFGLRIFVGIVFVGAPFTVLFVYFLLERLLRYYLMRLVAPTYLLSVPPSRILKVLPKMLFVCIVLGTVPVSVVGGVSLSQIYEIVAGRQPIGSFLSEAPLVIAFLLALGIFAAVALSFLLAKSISEPLRVTISAMERVRRGDLKAHVPVFSNDEIGRLAEGFNRMVEGLRERDLIRDAFGRYLSPEIAQEILLSGELNLRGELREITILVADLRNFTTLSEALDPQVILEMLNRYLERMTDIIVEHEGTIDEFTGDGILVFFGAPRRMQDHTRSAVECALEMQSAMKQVNKANANSGLPELSMGIGINSGELVVGNIGSPKRRKYGAVGSPINTAFRVEAETVGGEIIVTQAVYDELAGLLETASVRERHVKGINKPLRLYSVKDIRQREV
jgi:sigma-B regulation protein RsbU (phosphoserine phosphatase)